MGKNTKFSINGYKFDEVTFKDDDYVVYDITPTDQLGAYVLAKKIGQVIPGYDKSVAWMDNMVINMDDFVTNLQDPNSLLYDRIATAISNYTEYGVKKLEPIVIVNGENDGVSVKASFSANTSNDDWTLSNYRKCNTNVYSFDGVWKFTDGKAVLCLLPKWEFSKLDEMLKSIDFNEKTDVMIHLDVTIDSFSIHPNGDLHRDDRYGNMWEITYSISRFRGLHPDFKDILAILSLVHNTTDPHTVIARTKEFRAMFDPMNPIHKEILYCDIDKDSKGVLGKVKTRLYTDKYGKSQFYGDASMGVIDLDYTPWDNSNFFMWDYMGLMNACGFGCPRASYVIPYNLQANRSEDFKNEMLLTTPMIRFYQSTNKVARGNGFRLYKLKYSKLDFLLYGLIFFHVETEYNDDPYKIEKFLDIDFFNEELTKKMGSEGYVKYLLSHFTKFYKNHKDKYFFIPLGDSNALEEFQKANGNFADFFSSYQKIAFALVRKGQKYNGHELSEGLAWFFG